jgi:hypothetical protein
MRWLREAEETDLWTRVLLSTPATVPTAEHGFVGVHHVTYGQVAIELEASFDVLCASNAQRRRAAIRSCQMSRSLCLWAIHSRTRFSARSRESRSA